MVAFHPTELREMISHRHGATVQELNDLFR
jgi:hypothetical protein